MSESSFINLINNMEPNDLLQFLIEKNLIYDNMICEYCLNPMRMTAIEKAELGMNWRCVNKNCDHHQTTLSLLHNSFFHNSGITVKKNLLIMYFHLKKIKQDNVVEFVGVGRKTIGRIKQKIIENVTEYFSANPIRLGGVAKIVQVDETKLNHNIKSHRGRVPERPHWALTIVDTSIVPSQGYAEVIPDRSTETIKPIIDKVVRHRSHIFTDEWKAYDYLDKDRNFEHHTNTHKFHFVDPATGIHTQNVESYNNKIKYDIKTQRGVRRDQRQKFLNLFMFIDTYKETAMDKLLEILKV